MGDKAKADSAGQRDRIDSLRNEVEAKMKALRAENETSYERLRADMAEYNAKIVERMAEQSEKIAEQSERIAEQSARMAEQSKDVIKFIAAMAVGITVVLGVLVKW